MSIDVEFIEGDPPETEHDRAIKKRDEFECELANNLNTWAVVPEDIDSYVGLDWFHRELPTAAGTVKYFIETARDDDGIRYARAVGRLLKPRRWWSFFLTTPYVAG